MDENVQSGQWFSYVKIFLLIPALSGAIFYYVPVSRTYFRRGCVVFIDAVACTLKAALNVHGDENANTSQRIIPSLRISRTPKSREYGKNSRESKRLRRHEHRSRNRSVYEDVEEMDGNWPTVQIYPEKKHSLDRESVIDLKWDKRMSRRKDDGVLYSENVGPSQYYNDQLLVASVDDLENLNKNRMNEKTKKRKHNGHNSQSFYHEVNGVQDIDKNGEKVSKHRKKNRSMISDSGKSSRRNDDVEDVSKLIDNYLKNSSTHAETKWSRKNDSKHRNKSSVSTEDEKVYGTVNVDSSRLNRNFTMSTKKESLLKHKRNQARLPVSETEDLNADSEYYLQTPIITDRVTPMVQSAYQWVFGGCPSSKHRRR